MKFCFAVAAMISTGLLAQDAGPGQAPATTNPPATPAVEIPAPPSNEAAAVAAPAVSPENAPSKKSAAKRPAKKRANKVAAQKPVRRAVVAESKTVPLVSGPAVVVANHVNVRGQAGFKGEVITRMTNGEPVTVIEEVHLKHSGPEEPSAWAKIALPAHARAWVFASYVDTNLTVLPDKLNIRGGPGENYSILGRLRKGDSVTEIRTQGRWMEIQAPTNAYAFMAAEYLSQKPSLLAALAPAAPAVAAPTNAPAEATPIPGEVASEPALAAASTNTPATPETAAGTNELTSTNELAAAANEAPSNEVASATAPTNEVAAAAPAEQQPPPPRIVQREGIVRATFSIQAPTAFELISAHDHAPIDYLYTSSTNLDLSRYKGLRIIVTGEEGLDERWPNTPVISIHRIQVVD